MENIEKKTIIKCPGCGRKLLAQFKNETVKRLEILHRDCGIAGQLGIDIENNKLPIPITCSNPKCKHKFDLYFLFKKITGIMIDFEGESWETINGKKFQITKDGEKKLKKIRIKLTSRKNLIDN